MSKHKQHYDPDAEASKPEDKSAEVDLLTTPSHQELIDKLNEAEKKANDYWERILRMQADSENVSRRAERELSNAHKYAIEKFMLELLPIIDSLELSTTSVTPELQSAAGPVIEGVNLTLKMFYAAMEKFGIKQVNPLGEIFDPEHQQAISMEVDPSVPAGTVTSVLQKGYTLNGRLIRPALVVVAKA